MRHVIEEIPLQPSMTVTDSAIASDPRLAVSVNVNSGIDAQLGGTYVADTNTYWAQAQAARKRIGVTSRTTSTDVMHALADAATDDQILYFYCHAESAGLGDPGGPDASSLVLTDARITLADLNLDAPTTTLLRGKPLVFINACESAEMSPAFYDGFVPYFMAKGARGVVGTQCKTPALFAAEWAHRFFERFLDGADLGETFLELRREFLDKHGNPLGLLYAVHCDGDTRIEPALV
jgi:CHAT domain